MHANYPSLSGDPFPNPPSREVFFSSSVHQEAWTFLCRAAEAGEPFVLLSGEFGTGKTLLCMHFARMLEQELAQPYAHLTTPAQGLRDLLRRAHSALGTDDPPGMDQPIDNLIESLYDHFRERGPGGKRLFLLVEDAQDLDPASLHQLRLLPNFHVDGWYPICLVLFAHEAFAAMLREPSWQALDHRIRLRHRLAPLGLGETREYIYYRLLSAQSSEPTPFAPYFPESAIHRIHELTAGVPRAINNLCGQCLSIGGERGVVALDTGIVEEAARHFGWIEPAPEPAHAEAGREEPRHANAAPQPEAAAGTAQSTRAAAAAQPAEPGMEGAAGSRAEGSPDVGLGLDAASPIRQSGSWLATWGWWIAVALFLVLIVLVGAGRFYGMG